MNNIQSVDEIIRDLATKYSMGGVTQFKIGSAAHSWKEQAKADLLKLIEGAKPSTWVPRNGMNNRSMGYEEGVEAFHAALKELFGGNGSER